MAMARASTFVRSAKLCGFLGSVKVASADSTRYRLYTDFPSRLHETPQDGPLITFGNGDIILIGCWDLSIITAENHGEALHLG